MKKRGLRPEKKSKTSFIKRGEGKETWQKGLEGKKKRKNLDAKSRKRNLFMRGLREKNRNLIQKSSDRKGKTRSSESWDCNNGSRVTRETLTCV